jgi:site-specific DNA-methyltransferase (adenine-specific)
MSLRLAGFEVRDELMWMYGSGFPKSMNLGKSIDKKFGAEREVLRVESTVPGRNPDNWDKTKEHKLGNSHNGSGYEPIRVVTAPSTDEAKKYDGWGTALKPAHEPILLVRKPFKGSTTNNVLEHGTGGLNIDACRVETEDKYQINTFDDGAKPFGDAVGEDFTSRTETKGRWPANIIHDGSDEVVEIFPDTGKSSGGTGVATKGSGSDLYSGYGGRDNASLGGFGDSGNASRYFYCAKASKKEKNAGLDALPKQQKVFNGKSAESSEDMKDVEKRFTTQPTQNIHPTVKPVALMKHLVQMITPVDGVMLDPFAGSGTTGVAAKELGYDFILIEREQDYIPIIEGRLK